MVATLVGLKAFEALRWNKVMSYVLAVLLVLTAFFDSVLIAVGIFDYTPEKILGLRVGFAPIEDFMYAILAVVVVPAVWKKLGAHRAQ